MEKVFFQNFNNKRISIHTCCFRKKYLRGTIPDYSSENISVELDVNEKSETYFLENKYKYLVILYTFDGEKYGLMKTCEYDCSNKIITVNLIHTLETKDAKHIKMDQMCVCDITSMFPDITKYINKNNNEGIKFGKSLYVHDKIMNEIISLKSIGSINNDQNNSI